MKRLLFAAQIIFLGLFGISFLLFGLRFLKDNNPLTALDHKPSVYNQKEEFDPALLRLNTLNKIEEYCDSLYGALHADNNIDQFEQNFTNLVSSVVRNRFYHGYSYYGFNNNYIATIFSNLTQSGYSATVIPDDILSYPYAACSQQSIIMMEVLKDKGLTTRKVGFSGKKWGGHFCFEVFYKGNWHFYDPNLEPDPTLLNAWDHPSIAYLVAHPEMLLNAYRKLPKGEVLDIFPTYSYGVPNQFPAKTAMAFQKVTKSLSNSIFFYFLALFLFVRVWYIRLCRVKTVQQHKIQITPVRKESPSIFYPGLSPSRA
jgi:hypothetical protein